MTEGPISNGWTQKILDVHVKVMYVVNNTLELTKDGAISVGET